MHIILSAETNAKHQILSTGANVLQKTLPAETRGIHVHGDQSMTRVINQHIVSCSQSYTQFRPRGPAL
jgi:hypothetical protein